MDNRLKFTLQNTAPEKFKILFDVIIRNYLNKYNNLKNMAIPQWNIWNNLLPIQIVLLKQKIY